MKSRGVIIAWILGEAIVIYRGAFKEKRPPWPSELFYTSVVFVSLGFLAEMEAAATIAVLLGFGWDIAAFMNLFDPVTGKLKGGPPTTSLTGGSKDVVPVVKTT